MYQTEVDGQHYELGTSGFLYRSNKLMYDDSTFSLWSTLQGIPVVGKLVGQGIKLTPMHVVTTTWGKWKTLHPDTTVLSLNTGHRRNYGEGVAYREYFGSEKLMFEVPKHDDRLKDKAKVLILRPEKTSSEPLAIAVDFLANHPIYHGKIDALNFVVLTDSTGANRVYQCGDTKFETLDETTVVDTDGNQWRVTEQHLKNSEGHELSRLPAHRAYWFGWSNQFPGTQLVK